MTQPDRALRLTFACEDREIRLVSHQSGEVDGARGVRVGGRTSAHYGHPHHRHRRAVSLRDAMMAATMILSGAPESSCADTPRQKSEIRGCLWRGNRGQEKGAATGGHGSLSMSPRRGGRSPERHYRITFLSRECIRDGVPEVPNATSLEERVIWVSPMGRQPCGKSLIDCKPAGCLKRI